MISSLTGKIKLIEENFIILDVAGVGYKIFTNTFDLNKKLNEELFLYTYLAVRENSLDLFGFKTYVNLQLFELLITISGIGPKVALSIMNLTTPESLKRAVVSNNIEELTKISGIGKRNAKKIILELQNKIEKIEISTKEKPYDIEVYETLESLGFDRSRIREILPKLESKNTDGKIREALKLLAKN